MKLKLIAFLLLSFSQTLYGQVSISYFPFQSILSIGSNTEKLLWADYKLETNTFISNLNMEISPKWNFKRTEWVNYYVGAGVGFNVSYAFSNLTIMNGSFIDFGARIKPLAKNRNLQVVFEISPFANKGFNGGNIRTRLGIAWNFNKSKEPIN